MTTWFISRHPGAVAWMRQQPIQVDRYCAHLVLDEVQAGDVVIGSLPVHLAAALCARNVRYQHLAVDLPASARGHELSAEDLQRFGARLEAIEIRAMPLTHHD